MVSGGAAQLPIRHMAARAPAHLNLRPGQPPPMPLTRNGPMLTAALGCLGAALSMTLHWPQAWLSCVKGRTGGLSATASWLGVALPAGWITYGLLIGDRIQVATNAVTGAAGAAILIALLLARPDLRAGRPLLASSGCAVGLLLAAVGSGAATASPGVDGSDAAPLLGIALAVASILSGIPQPLALLRDRRQDLAGLSPARWQLTAVACAIWTAYGVRTGQVAVWSSAGIGLGSALVVCIVLMRHSTALDAITVPGGAAQHPARGTALGATRGTAQVPARGRARVVARGTALVAGMADMPTAVILSRPRRPAVGPARTVVLVRA